jgi:hypothetical protein
VISVIPLPSEVYADAQEPEHREDDEQADEPIEPRWRAHDFFPFERTATMRAMSVPPMIARSVIESPAVDELAVAGAAFVEARPDTSGRAVPIAAELVGTVLTGAAVPLVA